MNEVYAKTKTYLINEIAEAAGDVLNAIADKDPVAVDDMVGPCFSRDESAREFHHWKMLREINRYNAMKERLA